MQREEENDDIQLELGRSTRLSAVKRKSPLENRAMRVCACGQPADDLYPVFISEQAVRAIREHLLADPERELGGVLVGEFCKFGRGYFIQVNDIIRAEMAESTGISLTFTHEAWEQVHAQLAQRYSRERIVGWYHSHPGLGAFLSKEDEFIHQHYFADSYQIAMVVDSKLGEWAIFEWSQESLVRISGFYVFAPRSNEEALRECMRELSATSDHSTVTARGPAQMNNRLNVGRVPGIIWSLIILLAASQIALWLVVFRGRQATHPTTYLETAIEMLSIGDLTGGERLLRLELSANPENRQAFLEFQRVSAALSDSEIGNEEGEKLDRINLQLAAAARLARQLPRAQEPSLVKDIESSFTSNSRRPDIIVASPDYVKQALQVYKRAAASREKRIERACRVRDIVRSLKLSVAVHDEHGSNAWHEKAVRWLRGERSREIAYGVICREEPYDRLFHALSESDRRKVKRICASLGKPK